MFSNQQQQQVHHRRRRRCCHRRREVVVQLQNFLPIFNWHQPKTFFRDFFSSVRLSVCLSVFILNNLILLMLRQLPPSINDRCIFCSSQAKSISGVAMKIREKKMGKIQNIRNLFIEIMIYEFLLKNFMNYFIRFRNIFLKSR